MGGMRRGMFELSRRSSLCGNGGDALRSGRSHHPRRAPARPTKLSRRYVRLSVAPRDGAVRRCNWGTLSTSGALVPRGLHPHCEQGQCGGGSCDGGAVARADCAALGVSPTRVAGANHAPRIRHLLVPWLCPHPPHPRALHLPHRAACARSHCWRRITSRRSVGSLGAARRLWG